MKVEITDIEIFEIAKAFLILADSPRMQEINWAVIEKFTSKIDRVRKDIMEP